MGAGAGVGVLRPMKDANGAVIGMSGPDGAGTGAACGRVGDAKLLGVVVAVGLRPADEKRCSPIRPPTVRKRAAPSTHQTNAGRDPGWALRQLGGAVDPLLSVLLRLRRLLVAGFPGITGAFARGRLFVQAHPFASRRPTQRRSEVTVWGPLAVPTTLPCESTK